MQPYLLPKFVTCATLKFVTCVAPKHPIRELPYILRVGRPLLVTVVPDLLEHVTGQQTCLLTAQNTFIGRSTLFPGCLLSLIIPRL